MIGALACFVVVGWGLFVMALYRLGRQEVVYTRLVDAYRAENETLRRVITSQKSLTDALLAANAEKDLALEQIAECVSRQALSRPVERKWLN